MFKVIEISFGLLFSGLGSWVILRALPDVRARVLAGTGTPADAARLKNNKKVGIMFITAGLLAVLAGLLQL